MALSDADYARATDTERKDGDILAYKMGVTKIWKGDIVILKTDGYAYSSYETGATGDQFIGIAEETVDNTGGSAGDLNIRVYRKYGSLHKLEISSTAIATDLGLPVYNDRAAGPKFVTTTAGSHACLVGNIAQLGADGPADSGSYVWVAITPLSTAAS